MIMLTFDKNHLLKFVVVPMCLLWTGTVFAYETGEFEAPVNIGNGNYLYEGSVYHFEKDFGNHDTNDDGIEDTHTTKYSNEEGSKLYKRQALKNQYEGKIWEWSILKNLADQYHQDNYNLTDRDGDGTFDLKSQYRETHTGPDWRFE